MERSKNPGLTPKLVVLIILIYLQGQIDGSGAGIERSRFTLSIRACFARINIVGHPGPSIAYEETEER